MFGTRAVRVWTVMASMATVAGLVWTVLVVGPTETAGSGTGPAVTSARAGASSAPTSPSSVREPEPEPESTQPETTGAEPPVPAEAPATTAPGSADPAAGGPVWMAQLASVPVSEAGRLPAVLTGVRRDVPAAQVLLSTDYASLRPGYWVVYALAGFDDGHDALAYCASRGRATADTCIGRRLSHRASDFPYQCRPRPTTLPSRCE
jgi:eukaryotic-like serine/threonine-protein kinase